jgi:ribosomal protein S18
MPVRITKAGKRYRVTDAGRVTAKGTTKAKAKRQGNLLRAVAHGWKPTRRR